MWRFGQWIGWMLWARLLNLDEGFVCLAEMGLAFSGFQTEERRERSLVCPERLVLDWAMWRAFAYGTGTWMPDLRPHNVRRDRICAPGTAAQFPPGTTSEHTPPNTAKHHPDPASPSPHAWTCIPHPQACQSRTRDARIDRPTRHQDIEPGRRHPRVVRGGAQNGRRSCFGRHPALRTSHRVRQFQSALAGHWTRLSKAQPCSSGRHGSA